MNDVRHGGNQESSDAADPVEAHVIAPLQRARLAPDDLQLARLGAALDAALLDAARARAPERAAWRARWARRSAVGASLAAAAVAALIVVPSLRHASPPDASTRARKPMPIAPEDHRLALAGPASGLLVVPAGARFRGQIGARVRFTLVGPGEVSAFAVDGGTDLELESGRLLVDYDGHGGETLRVRSPGAVTTVVGTLFAVEALGRTSRVAVARGSVAVEGAGARVEQIAAGSSWLTEALEPEPIPGDLAADLATQDVAAAAGRGELADRASSPPPAAQAPIVAATAARDDRPRTGAADARAKRPPRPAPAEGETETAYAAAEELMRAGSTTAARRALLDFVTAHPADPRAELALLDLARLALAAGHPVEARGYVTRLLASTKDDALVDLAHQVERRIDAAAATTGASGP
jgi:hypothetical protein